MADETITDVVGATEAHEILGVELQRISRWRKAGKLPPPYCDLRLSPVWVRADIVRLAKTGDFNGATKPPAVPPLMGTAEVAVMLDVDKSQVARWRSRPNKHGPRFPEPVARIKAGPLWLRRDITAFKRARSISARWAFRRPPCPSISRADCSRS